MDCLHLNLKCDTQTCIWSDCFLAGGTLLQGFQNFGRQSLAGRKGQPLVPVMLSPSLLCYEKSAVHAPATVLSLM